MTTGINPKKDCFGSFWRRHAVLASPEEPFPAPNTAGNQIGVPTGIPIIAIRIMKKPKINLIVNLNSFNIAFFLSACLRSQPESKTSLTELSA